MTTMTSSTDINGEASKNTLIVPVRVDVLSDDKTIRIVDTLLLDPTCWPVALYQPLHASVEENTTQLAHTILSDAEVQVSLRTGLKIKPD